MLLWILLHILRFGVFYYLEPISRFLWYAYYIPLIFISLLSFFAATCLGKAEEWRPGHLYNLLFIPATILILLFLSNDRHQWAFSYPEGIEHWSELHRFGPVYYLVIAWVAGCMIASLCSLYRKSHIPHTRKRVWLPFSMIGIGFMYAVLYATGSAQTNLMFIEKTVLYCVLAAAIWESFIQIKLLPSNVKYSDFFRASDLSAMIDDNGQRRGCADPLQPFQSRESGLDQAARVPKKHADRLPYAIPCGRH